MLPVWKRRVWYVSARGVYEAVYEAVYARWLDKGIQHATVRLYMQRPHTWRLGELRRVGTKS